VVELSMTALLASEEPSVIFDHPDDISHLHDFPTFVVPPAPYETPIETGAVALS
jgi:hypothetical protein